MSLRDKQLERRLALVQDGLSLEFPSVPRSEIEESLSRVVVQLLADARVLDYVPVLAGRFARERLRARQDAVAVQAA